MENNSKYVQFVIVISNIKKISKYYIVGIYSILNVLINGWELIVNVPCVSVINLELGTDVILWYFISLLCFLIGFLLGWGCCGKYKNKVLPRFELGLLDSESNVLTITP